MAARTAPPRQRATQRGFTLIEVLVSVLIFSVGILAAVGLQARAVRLSTDAQQRAQAAFLADQLFARLLIADPTAAASFNHKPGAGPSCAPTGSASTNSIVTEWLDEITAAFPLASASEQQVVVTGTPANEVTIRLCWKNGTSDTPHTLEVSNRVQWQ